MGQSLKVIELNKVCGNKPFLRIRKHHSLLFLYSNNFQDVTSAIQIHFKTYLMLQV